MTDFCSMIQPSEGVLAVLRDSAVIIKSVSGSKAVVKSSAQDKTVKLKELVLIHPGPAAAIAQNIEAVCSCEEAVELIGDEQLDFRSFCELLYGNYSCDSAWSAYQLAANGVWFDIDEKNNISCKPEDERNALIAEREKKELAKRKRAELVERIRNLSVLPEDLTALREIEDVAYGQCANSKLMKDAGIEASPEKAHRLLLDLGVWDITRNPWIKRFNEDVSEITLAPDGEESFERVDLTHMASYAIDDQSSNDPDDALSFENGKLFVHIADPLCCIKIDGKIAKEASMRGESLYLPELISPMFPDEIRKKCALGLNDVSCAMTFVLDIKEDGDVVLEKYMLSRVRVTRLDYDGCAERLLTEDFVKMSTLLGKFRDFRISNGAKLITLPEVKIKLENNKVVITPCEINPARELVANAMLATGYAVAKFMTEQEMNFPFAVQNPPDEEPEYGNSISAMFAMRRSSKPGRIEFKGGVHSGLGLAPYSRVTSPLRRYADLLAHYQLRSLLTGAEPLSFEELSTLMIYAENAAASRRKLEKYSNEYYTTVFLAQNPGYTCSAVLAAKQNGILTFIIPELAYEYKCRIQGNFQLDETYRLTLISADPAEMRTAFKVERA